MRSSPMPRTLILLAAAAMLAGCMTAPRESRISELDRLIEECRERGGILTPIPGGPRSGNEAANHTCEIRGGGSRIR